MEKAPIPHILRFLAAEEPLERTVDRFPGLSREELGRMLERLAEQVERAAPERAKQGGQTDLFPPTKRPPPSPAGAWEKLRVYSDGAARGNPGPAGAGAVLVNPKGEVVERLGRFLGERSNNYAEYQGLLLGLERARELGAREVEVYADSELMIRQLQGRYQVRSPLLRPLWEQAMGLLQGFEQVRLRHIPREQNADADEMSNRAIDEEM